MELGQTRCNKSTEILVEDEYLLFYHHDVSGLAWKSSCITASVSSSDVL